MRPLGIGLNVIISIASGLATAVAVSLLLDLLRRNYRGDLLFLSLITCLVWYGGKAFLRSLRPLVEISGANLIVRSSSPLIGPRMIHLCDVVEVESIPGSPDEAVRLRMRQGALEEISGFGVSRRRWRGIIAEIDQRVQARAAESGHSSATEP